MKNCVYTKLKDMIPRGDVFVNVFLIKKGKQVTVDSGCTLVYSGMASGLAGMLDNPAFSLEYPVVLTKSDKRKGYAGSGEAYHWVDMSYYVVPDEDLNF